MLQHYYQINIFTNNNGKSSQAANIHSIWVCVVNMLTEISEKPSQISVNIHGNNGCTSNVDKLVVMKTRHSPTNQLVVSEVMDWSTCGLDNSLTRSFAG